MTDPKDPQAELREKLKSYNANWVIPGSPGLTIHMLPDRCVDDFMELFQAHQQQLLTELLGELPKPKKIEIYNAYNQPDDPFPMGFNAAIGETVSVIERLQNKTNDGGTE